MMRLTLDTSCVVHSMQGQAFAEPVNELVDLAREGLVGIWLTSAFHDTTRAEPRGSTVKRTLIGFERDQCWARCQGLSDSTTR